MQDVHNDGGVSAIIKELCEMGAVHSDRITVQESHSMKM